MRKPYSVGPSSNHFLKSPTQPVVEKNGSRYACARFVHLTVRSQIRAVYYFVRLGFSLLYSAGEFRAFRYGRRLSPFATTGKYERNQIELDMINEYFIKECSDDTL